MHDAATLRVLLLSIATGEVEHRRFIFQVRLVLVAKARELCTFLEMFKLVL